MYSNRFRYWSRIGVYTAVVVLVAVTLFGSIAPASPTLEQTKRDIENSRYQLPTCGLWIASQASDEDEDE